MLSIEVQYLLQHEMRAKARESKNKSARARERGGTIEQFSLSPQISTVCCALPTALLAIQVYGMHDVSDSAVTNSDPSGCISWSTSMLKPKPSTNQRISGGKTPLASHRICSYFLLGCKGLYFL